MHTPNPNNNTDTTVIAGANITGTEPQAPFDWRALLDVHPAAELFPPISEAELLETAERIRANGLRVPIVVWSPSDGSKSPVLIDGRNRLNALTRLGLLYRTEDGHIGLKTWDGKKWLSLSGERIHLEHVHDDPYAIALSLNVHRRHLTPEQKRDLIAKVLAADPEKSNRQIAKETKADDKTVEKVRTELEARSEIPNAEKRKDSKGREQPARKQTRTPKAAPKAPKPATPKPKRTTALDVLAVWKDLPVAEHRRFFDGIGLNAVLAGIAEAWLPELQRWVANRTAPQVPQ
jgi:hypothetical protein